MMARIAPLILALLALVAAGCGDDGGTTAAAATPSPAMHERGMRPVAAARLKVVSSRYGRILADARGQAVYLFDRETSRTPQCYGACAKAWPPVLAKQGAPTAAQGARPALLGVTTRRNGDRQLVYRGRPLYLFAGDSPGRVLCHGVREYGGLWLVVRPDGTPVPA